MVETKKYATIYALTVNELNIVRIKNCPNFRQYVFELEKPGVLSEGYKKRSYRNTSI
jgi:hypothetical protein